MSKSMRVDRQNGRAKRGRERQAQSERAQNARQSHDAVF